MASAYIIFDGTYPFSGLISYGGEPSSSGGPAPSGAINRRFVADYGTKPQPKTPKPITVRLEKAINLEPVARDQSSTLRFRPVDRTPKPKPTPEPKVFPALDTRPNVLARTNTLRRALAGLV